VVGGISMKKRILIIEDEVQIARGLQLELEYEGFEVLIEYNGKSGLDTAMNEKLDLILLDVMLPELSGIEVLRRLRKSSVLTLIILLTARNTTFDKVIGLDQGANDYITKPFEIEELLARVRSIIRYNDLIINQKSTCEENKIVSVCDLILNTETREVTRNGRTEILTPKEYDLLMYLIINKNKIATRDGIISKVWGYDFEGETNVIDVYIRHLRKKVDEHSPFPLIHTVHGVGYTIKEKHNENYNKD
jgi:DNA-binding response OmpR family regulator